MEPQQITPTPAEIQPKPNHNIFYILIFIFLAIVGSSIYLFYLNYNYNPMCVSDCGAIVVPDFDETDSWKIYEDKKSGFNFKYPNDWNIATSNITRISENTLLFTGALIIQSTSSPSMGEIALAPVGGMWLSVVPVETCDDPSFNNINSDFSMMTDLDIAKKSICSGPFRMDVGLWTSDSNFNDHKIILDKILSTFKFTNREFKISGFYFKENQTAWEETLLCDKFAVIKGDEYFINKYKSWVNRGNTVNHIDIDGRLVLSLDLSKLSTSTKNKIENSNLNNTIDLEIIEREEAGHGVPACYSIMDIIE